MAITISEIAKMAGVSRTTVSYVLNGKGNIPDSTRNRILKIMQENEYQPNDNARRLAIGKNLRVGIFIPSAEYLKKSVFFSEFSATILPVINQHGVDLVVEIYDSIYEHWLQKVSGLDGVILINPGQDGEQLQWLRNAKIPVVVVGRPDHSDSIHYVDGPNTDMATEMTQRVLACGHRNILYILPDARYTLTDAFLTGIQRVLDQQEDNIQAHYCYTTYGEELQREWLLQNLEKAGDVTAIIVDSDYKAVQTLELLQQCGKRVPEDISLVCLSGSYLTQIPTPKICSSNQNVSALGERAAYLLLDLLEGKVQGVQQPRIVDYFVVEGESLDRIKKKV